MCLWQIRVCREWKMFAEHGFKAYTIKKHTRAVNVDQHISIEAGESENKSWYEIIRYYKMWVEQTIHAVHRWNSKKEKNIY